MPNLHRDRALGSGGAKLCLSPTASVVESPTFQVILLRPPGAKTHSRNRWPRVSLGPSGLAPPVARLRPYRGGAYIPPELSRTVRRGNRKDTCSETRLEECGESTLERA